MGWMVRYLAYLLEQNGIQFFGYDVSHLFFAENVPQRVLAPPLEENITLILALMPDRYRYALSALPRRVVRNAYLIGYSVYELERLPPEYCRGLRDVDEIWTPSSFSAAAFAAAAPRKPVRIMPHIIRAPASQAADRAAFGLPANAFIAMAFGNVKSGTIRKNLAGAVQAFHKAFPDDADVRLVLKVSDSDWAKERTDRLGELAAHDRRIAIHTKMLSDDEVWAFIACADVVISLHRSEGFGLVLAQAMMVGIPLITTLWSGERDFASSATVYEVHHSLVPVSDPEGMYLLRDTRWAEPDIDHAASLLRLVRENPEAARSVAGRARKSIRAFMEPHRWAAPLNEALCQTPRRPPALMSPRV
jgi:glycosyltransferase involved in cell wall biosynthesis